MLFPSVNFLAVILAAITNMVIGFAWYSPYLLGKPWMRLMGFTAKTLKTAQTSMGGLYGLSFVATIIQASVIGVVLKMAYVQTLGSAVILAGMLWLGLVAVTQFTGEIFTNKPFNPHLLAINTGYQLVSILVMTIILFSLK